MSKIFNQPGTGRYPVSITLIPPHDGAKDAQISLQLVDHSQYRTGIYIGTKNLDEFITMLQEVRDARTIQKRIR